MQKKRTYTTEQKDMQKTLAERLKKLRTDKGLSHEKLIEEIENKYKTTISKQTLIDYEKGVYDEYDRKQNAGLGMNIAFLWTFAKYFKVSTDYLLGLSEHKTPHIEERAISEKLGITVEIINNFIEETKFDKDTPPFDEHRNYYHYEVPRPPFVEIRNKFLEHYNFDKLIYGIEKFIYEYENMLCEEILHFACYGQDTKDRAKIKELMEKMIDMPDFKHSDNMTSIGGLMYLMTQHIDKMVSDIFKGFFSRRFDMLHKSIKWGARDYKTKEEVDAEMEEELNRLYSAENIMQYNKEATENGEHSEN